MTEHRSDPDAESLELLEDGLRKTMLSTSGAELDAALAELGWADMLTDMPELAIPLVFRLLGETGSHASVLNDVVLQAAGRELGGTPALPYAGGGWVVWDYAKTPTDSTLGGLPLRRVEDGELLRLADARRALGWWLVGAAARCWPWHASMRWTGSNSADRSRRSRRSGTGWPRRWWPSKAPRRR